MNERKSEMEDGREGGKIRNSNVFVWNIKEFSFKIIEKVKKKL